MVYKGQPGETEFGGVDGMFPDQNVAAPSLQQEMWALYATNEGGAPDVNGADTSAEEWGRTHIGEPRESFSIPGAEPNLTIAPWPPEEDEED